MAQWPDNQNPGGHRPEFDRTIIRPSGKGSATLEDANDRPDLAGRPQAPDRPKVPVKASPKRSSKLLYAAMAIGFLVVGAGAGGLAHLFTSGAISFSPPEETATSDTPDSTEEAATPGPLADASSAAQEAGQGESPSVPEEIKPERLNEEDLDIPADPFFDMAMSAVIPLAGDPVLLGRGAAAQRIELTERPVPASASPDDAAFVPAASAYFLDSQMLDEDGNLIISAPGSETDFQFGNFGGGSDSEGIVVEEDSSQGDGQSPDLPVFLKPPTDTLNLFLSERPIGQGPSRIEIRTGISEATTLGDFLKDNSFDEDAGKLLVDFAASEFQKSDLIAGDKIAIRGVRMPNKLGRIGDYYRPVQISFYGQDGYLGTAAFSTSRDGDTYVHGADPWFGKPIVEEDIAPVKVAGAAKKHRLIDGLYATAVRNAVPASIVGEAIAYLAPTTDLKRTIEPDERFTLVFTDMPRDEKRGGGRVLFAGVRRGDDWSVRCYVLKAPGNRGFACVNEGGKVSLSGAMLVPVKGVLTSKFGMRFHPIKKTERLHAGVDWAAPTGTPIRAAFSGKITYRAVRGGYGNFIELTHKDGITSRYAHMHEFADGIELGSVVQAGDLIGYVGTTGLSTGPHLHFEIRQRGEPADPLAFEMETGADAPQSVASNDLKNYRVAIGDILSVQ
ncbi:M23 family metallopeptidase [uncultured Roseibium sp.]|uniref:M23 family metallopeptidase n=1 Tax=uncultured Roseibium sp. TaxID=1936171 RepID=UPI002610303E|nr:M23 family metallopeptidase [uncultured Roseibium sp.]